MKNLKRKNENTLQYLEYLLSSGRFLTARQIAFEMACCKMVAHKNLRVLRRRGVVMQTCRIREGGRGPESIGYAIVKIPARNRLPKSRPLLRKVASR